MNLGHAVCLQNIYFTRVPVITKVSPSICHLTYISNSSVLLERANEWLENHGDVTLISCETVTWHGLKVDEIFADNTTALKSFDGRMNSKQSKTYNLRGLR